MNSRQVYAHLKNVRIYGISKLVKPTTVVEPTFSISKTIGQMLESDSYDVFCMDDGNIRTTNARELLSSRDISNMKISIFLRRIEHVTPGDTLEKAATIISHYRMRSVPVMEGKQLIGAVYAKDLIEILNQQNLDWILANNIMVHNPIMLDSNESLATARKIMMTKRIDHLPIIYKGKVSQVVTSMHLLQALKPEERIGSDSKGLNTRRKFESHIGNIGSNRIPNCPTNSSLNTVMNSMLKNNATCCLLTLWEDLLGIITYRDLLNLIESRIESDVPLYIVGLPESLNNADIIKTKFEKIIRNLSKVYPEVEEAKTSIKTIHNPSSNRQHYEASIRIITPYKNHSYSEIGWDLSKIFDMLGTKIIRNLSKRSKKRWKTSIRKIDKKDIF
jgi:CBS domain-containing protein